MLKEWILLFKRHQSDQNHQRCQFNEQISKIEPDTAILVMDFKENVKINISHDTQVTSEFYTPPQRSVFDIIMFYADKDGKTQKHCFDIVSDCTKHDSFFAINALGLVFNENDFKSQKFSTLKFWMDNCPNQFKTKEIFASFAKLDQKTFWNFFIEYHGKNPCDARFSRISAMLKDHNMDPSNKRITSTKDLIDVIREQQSLHNKWRVECKKPAIKSTQLELKIDQVPSQKTHIEIENFKFLHSFEMKDNCLVGYALTNETKIFKKWPASFKKVPRKSNLVKNGYDVDEDLTSIKLWETVSNKFEKIDQFLVQNKSKKLRKVSKAPEIDFISDLEHLFEDAKTESITEIEPEPSKLLNN